MCDGNMSVDGNMPDGNMSDDNTDGNMSDDGNMCDDNMSDDGRKHVRGGGVV